MADPQLFEMAPVLINRANGGVLAISPPGARLRIGVTADTKEDAITLFKLEARRWAYDLGRERRKEEDD